MKNRERIIKKRIPNERRWYDCKIHEVTQIKYEIIELLSKEYNTKSLCLVLRVSRSGYYKWINNKDVLNQYEINRKNLGELIKDIHKRKPSYGYHRIRKIILDETGWVVSANLVHKVCKILKIKSKAKHYKYKKPGEESVKYENIIGYNWNTSRPFEKIVSDTTSFYFKKKKYDWTFYLDVFNNEIVGSDVRETMYGNGILNHKKAVENMLNNKIKRGYKDLDTIVHTDQGIIYSSVSFNNIFNSYSVTRSMSRAGTPTDNPVIESKNGWIKKEMYIDFDINNYNTVQEFIDDIIWDNNNYRPSYALNYKTPIEYRTQSGFQ
ncbi:MAG: IS3 family transposase [Firmicutes bacterium]|nr:IS3 family transposase [Bacillota bacterium]